MDGSGPLSTGRSRKASGAFYTPEALARTLLQWVIRDDADSLLDPSCGDGAFLAIHRNSTGVEREDDAVRGAALRAPHASIHHGDFFEWADTTPERFDCAAGNPPFLRYQTFKGEVRSRALALCSQHGADFTGLTSSWPPFLVATAALLKKGGRMAFVVPAEIGHAPYAAPLMDYLLRNFATVHVVAVRQKLFPVLSEDCWLLYVDGFGGSSEHLRFSVLDGFDHPVEPPGGGELIPAADYKHRWNRRLRPYLLQPDLRHLYAGIAKDHGSYRLSQIAKVGVGYVSGDNGFFHLRPSQAQQHQIPTEYLVPSVRNSRGLPAREITPEVVDGWRTADLPMYLLRITPGTRPSPAVQAYLDTAAGQTARRAYKCRNRNPWFVVPDVREPDFMLSYMSGRTVALVRNTARITCSNAIHAVHVREPRLASDLLPMWGTLFLRLSCELEGHPLGGGMLKLEPREAGKVLFPSPALGPELADNATLIAEGVATMQRWRHYE